MPRRKSSRPFNFEYDRPHSTPDTPDGVDPTELLDLSDGPTHEPHDVPEPTALLHDDPDPHTPESTERIDTFNHGNHSDDPDHHSHTAPEPTLSLTPAQTHHGAPTPGHDAADPWQPLSSQSSSAELSTSEQATNPLLPQDQFIRPTMFGGTSVAPDPRPPGGYWHFNSMVGAGVAGIVVTATSGALYNAAQTSSTASASGTTAPTTATTSTPTSTTTSTTTTSTTTTTTTTSTYANNNNNNNNNNNGPEQRPSERPRRRDVVRIAALTLGTAATDVEPLDPELEIATLMDVITACIAEADAGPTDPTTSIVQRIFVAPEWYFRRSRPHGSGRPYDDAEFADIHRRIGALSRRFPAWTLAPGTVYHGERSPAHGHRFLVQNDGFIAENNRVEVVPKRYEADALRDDEIWGAPRPTNSRFVANGYIYGIEVCRDHKFGLGLVQTRQLVDVHILISNDVRLLKCYIIARDGGLLVWSEGLGHGKLTIQRVRWSQNPNTSPVRELREQVARNCAELGALETASTRVSQELDALRQHAAELRREIRAAKHPDPTLQNVLTRIRQRIDELTPELVLIENRFAEMQQTRTQLMAYVTLESLSTTTGRFNECFEILADRYGVAP